MDATELRDELSDMEANMREAKYALRGLLTNEALTPCQHECLRNALRGVEDAAFELSVLVDDGK